MSKPVGTAQSHAIIQALANNVDWSSLDADLLQEKIIRNQKEAGRLFTLFLRNGCESLKEAPRVFNINRDEPFDPVVFFNADWNNQPHEGMFINYTPSEHEAGKGWKIKLEDEKSLALKEIDLNEILLESTLSKNEHGTTIKERILRLKNAGHTLLDAAVFKSFIDNQGLIPASFKRKINHEPIRIFFDGSIFENEAGDEHVLYLLYVENKVRWHYAWTGSTCNQSDYSAVI